MFNYIPFKDQPRAYGDAPVTARLKQTPEDFRVEEKIKFLPSGVGEHIYLLVEKISLNTEDVRQHLAKCAQVKTIHVSYAGLKDKNAVSRQWFSIYLPKGECSITPMPGMNIIEQTRHEVKLRRGMVKENHFKILVTCLEGDKDELERRLVLVKEQGAPNYFAEQRFSKDGKNVLSAYDMFSKKLSCKKFRRSIYLSAARSYLFNLVLAERIKQGTWQQLLPGEAVMLQGSRSFFVAEEKDEALEQRLQQWDVHPSGPLWGRGKLVSELDCKQFECHTLHDHDVFRLGLEEAGLKQERRSLRLGATDMHWSMEANQMSIEFSLTAGEYATALLRECMDFTI